MAEDIGRRIEEATRQYARSGNIEEQDISDLFSGDKVQDYAAHVHDPTQYNRAVMNLALIMEQLVGEPLYCLHVIEALTYDSFKTLAARFRENPSTRQAIGTFIKRALGHIFDETEDIGQHELNRYLPILESWTDYLTDSEIYEAIHVGFQSSCEVLHMHIEDGEEDEVAEQSNELLIKSRFIKKTRSSIYNRLREKCAADNPGLIFGVE